MKNAPRHFPSAAGSLMDRSKKLISMAAALSLLSSEAILHAAPPGATPAAGEAAASTSADATQSAPDGTSKAAPGQIPLHIKPHDPNGNFRYPFLGTVKAYAQSRVLRVHTSSGALAQFPVKVFYAKNGNFIRAEFVKPGAGDFQNPVKEIEEMAKQDSQAITGLPDKPMAISLENLLDQLKMRFEDATRFNITYVLYKANERPAEPMIILNIFGLQNFVSARFGDAEKARRSRMVMDKNGAVKWEDILL
jgi:hypothetical protein